MSSRKIDIKTCTSIIDAFISKAKNEKIGIVSFVNSSSRVHDHGSTSITILTKDQDFVIELSLFAFEVRILMESESNRQQRTRHGLISSFRGPHLDVQIVARNPWGHFSPLYRKLKAMHKELEQEHRNKELSETMDLINQRINLTDYIVEKEVLKGGK